MKKTVAVLLVLMLFLSAGCGRQTEQDGGGLADVSGELGDAGGERKNVEVTPIPQKSKDDAGKAERVRGFNFAVDGYVLKSETPHDDWVDITTRYQYDDQGLCIKAYTNDEARTFRYDYDSEGRPVTRYVTEDGVTSICEAYDYYSTGELKALRIYEEGELLEAWTYDRKGRATSGSGISIVAPSDPGYPYINFQNAEWDDEDRLLTISFPILGRLEDMARWGLNNDGTEEESAALAQRLKAFARSHGIEPDGDGYYEAERFTYTYEYDDRDRLAFCAISDMTMPLMLYARTGTEQGAAERIDCFRFAYDGNSFTISTWYEKYTGGKLEDKSKEPIEKTLAIQYNAAGLPVSAGGVSTDIYDSLRCTVTSTEVGWFPITWCRSYYNLDGELQGGMVGVNLQQLTSNIVSGYTQMLRVKGKTSDGSEAVYLLYPDSLGRQRCTKLVDGRLIYAPSTNIDHKASFTYFVTDDSPERKYIALN